ncbi:hypothetical protein FCM35_KLT04850 [Carex littledalei]|uniref:Uncharacterized protein n=1 Tax=Carex littledalei TaxID=544730 RepID=A0A833VNI5_9POAL|nr:hypothetical protein FCM35_KLT04850 [Carex littledalei]
MLSVTISDAYTLLLCYNCRRLKIAERKGSTFFDFLAISNCESRSKPPGCRALIMELQLLKRSSMQNLSILFPLFIIFGCKFFEMLEMDFVVVVIMLERNL